MEMHEKKGISHTHSHHALAPDILWKNQRKAGAHSIVKCLVNFDFAAMNLYGCRKACVQALEIKCPKGAGNSFAIEWRAIPSENGRTESTGINVWFEWATE